MKIEATREDIRVLLELNALDESAEPVATEARAREAAERRLPDELLTRYRSLTATGRYPATVAAEHETCTGCHIRLATMLADRIKRALGLYPCPRCRRMLYAPALLAEAPAEVAVERPAGSRRRPRHTSAHHS